MGNDLTILDVINIQTPLGTFELIFLALAVLGTLVAIWKSPSGPSSYHRENHDIDQEDE